MYRLRGGTAQCHIWAFGSPFGDASQRALFSWPPLTIETTVHISHHQGTQAAWCSPDPFEACAWLENVRESF